MSLFQQVGCRVPPALQLSPGVPAELSCQSLRPVPVGGVGARGLGPGLPRYCVSPRATFSQRALRWIIVMEIENKFFFCRLCQLQWPY